MPPRPRPSARSPPSPPPPIWKRGCPACAPPAPASAPTSPRCAPSSRRSCARPNSPTAGCRSSPPTKTAGCNGRKARATRSPRWRAASPRPRATAPKLLAEKRGALISEVEAAEAERRACADRLQEAETALAEADRDARAALDAASAARQDLAPGEQQFQGAKRPPS